MTPNPTTCKTWAPFPPRLAKTRRRSFPPKGRGLEIFSGGLRQADPELWRKLLMPLGGIADPKGQGFVPAN